MLLFFLLSCFAEPKSLIPPRVESADIRVDGHLDEDQWQQALAFEDFIQVQPDDTGKQPEWRTEVRLFYTPKTLYVGIWCEEPGDRQNGRLSNRDNDRVERDFVRLILSPRYGRQGYYAELGLGGAKRDGTVLPESRFFSEWDGPWAGETHASAEGWSAEFAIPWSMIALPYSADPERLLGFQVERWVSPLAQKWAWQPLFPRDPQYLSALGQMRIKQVSASANWALYPYVAGIRSELQDTTTGKVGTDLFWNPKPGVRVAATFNPDFGQVEADDIVVNLGAFETFFPEKRPFFLEDKDVFDTRKYELIHTRRIGSAPDYESAGPIESQPGASDILAAVKLTGSLDRTRFGLLAAQEDKTSVTGADGLKRDLDGRTYLALRGSREWRGESGSTWEHGSLVTFTDRPEADRQATVYSYDGAFRSSQGKWDVRWQAIGSSIDQHETQSNGFGAWLDGTYQQRRGVYHQLVLQYLDDQLDFNDMGYLQANSRQSGAYFFDWRNQENLRFKYVRTHFEAISSADSHGLDLGRDYGLNREWGFLNNTRTSINIGYHTGYWDDRFSFGHGDVWFPDRWNMELFWDSDSRKKVGAFLEWDFWEEPFGDISNATIIFLRYTPNDHWDYRVSNIYQHRNDQVLFRPGGTFALFQTDQTLPSFYVNALFSSHQDLRFALQWVGLRARASEIRDLGADGRLRSSMEDPSDQDFNLAFGVLQIRYRLELAPLSELYVVYSRGGSFYERPSDPGRDFLDLWDEARANKDADQFVAKIRYRF
ncbi:MAG: hypothetical protein H6510_02880 [Acidobacteria bacterium]|nr:hypothetical protein [Acidobacteriota bacterium]